jgi:hypothetical protein
MKNSGADLFPVKSFRQQHVLNEMPSKLFIRAFKALFRLVSSGGQKTGHCDEIQGV